MTTKLLKRTLFLLLPAFLLLCPGKAWAKDPEPTNWIGQLSGISIGTNGDETDITITITQDPATDTTYIVKTAKGLAWIAKVTNEKLVKKDGDNDTNNYPSTASFKGCTVKLENDIDLSDHYWTPIGDYTNGSMFQGIFEGNHKIIKGLKIKIEVTKSQYIYVGLFGYLMNSKVSNLGIQIANEGGIEVTSTSTGRNERSYVGGLAGFTSNFSPINNCFVTGGGINVNSKVPIRVGGLVGQNVGTITNCYTTVNVSAESDDLYAGGIVGYGNGDVSNVYATGKIEATGENNDNRCGGIIGFLEKSALTNALALNIKGITVGKSGNPYDAGRLVGHCNGGTINNSYASTKIRLNGNEKGASNATGEKIFKDGLPADTDTDLSKLFSGDDWEIKEEGKLPTLKGFSIESNNLLAKADYLDAPLSISNSNDYTLTYSDADGWKNGETSFSGRIKGSSTSSTLTISSAADYEVPLFFADGFSIQSDSKPTTITVNKGGTTDSIAFIAEGTATVKAKDNSSTALSVTTGATCTFDRTNRFHIYGGITNSGTLQGLMQWQWNIAPATDVFVEWPNGSTTIPGSSTYTHLATNPDSNDNITVRTNNEGLKGKKNAEGTAITPFAFDTDSRAFIYYTEMSAASDKGSKENPYIINLTNPGQESGPTNNGYSFESTTSTITLNTDNGYYRLEGKTAESKSILTLGENKTCHLLAAPDCQAHTLIIPTNTTCTFEGDQPLTAIAVQVTDGGIFNIDAPLTLKMDEKASSETIDRTCLYIENGGKVTINNEVKLSSSIADEGIASYVGTNSILSITRNGKMYGYGTNCGCYLIGDLIIENGGIMKLASIDTNSLYYANPSALSLPLIQWIFTDTPQGKITEKNSNGTITFSEDDFGEDFKSAKSFTTNVAANTEYTLVMATTTGSEKILSGSLEKVFTRQFVSPGNFVTYENVGILPSIQEGTDVYITEDGKYTIGEDGDKQSFNNILSGSNLESLIVSGNTKIGIVLKGVTIENLTVEQNKNGHFYLNESNTISTIEVESGAFCSIEEEGGGSLSDQPTITNNGTFIDETGQISSVLIPSHNDPGNSFVPLSVNIEGENEVEPNSTTILTAESSVGSPVTKALSDYTGTTSYAWEKKTGDVWEAIPDATARTYAAGSGIYRCRVTETVTVNDQDIATTLYTPSKGVTEKSGSGGDDSDPDPDPVPDPTPVFHTVTLSAVEGATTDPVAGSYLVEEWSNFRFYLTLDPAYDQSTPVVTTSRGETLQPRTGDGAYLVNHVLDDVTILIDGIRKNVATSNESVEDASAVQVRRVGSHIVISSPAAAEVRIYDFGGALFSHARLSEPGEITLAAPAGPCIVAVGKRRFKIAP